MERAPHFIQVGEAPAVIGEGVDELACACGQSVLVKGYIAANLLAIDIRCAACGKITATPGVPDGARPPYAVTPVERRAEPLPSPATVGRQTALASYEEVERLAALYGPLKPASDLCLISEATLDNTAAEYDRLSHGRLADDLATVAAAGTGALAGLRQFPLAWAIRRLRSVHATPGWTCAGTNEDSVATTLVAAFGHFNACWSHHPLFGAMAEAAADRGFSLHAISLFGAAKCLADAGNRVGFMVPRDAQARITGFYLAIGPSDRWNVEVDTFDRFEWPHGQQWNPAALRAAVGDAVTSAQGRLNPRHPGMLVLSVGAARSMFDVPLVDAIRQTLRVQGRRHRGMAAISAIFPQFLTTERPDQVSFGYGFYPFENSHYAGSDGVRIGTGGRLSAG